MAFTWWLYRTRHFTVYGLDFAVKSRARSDGLVSQLFMLGVEQASDVTPLLGPESVRNHQLACTLPDGRALTVELGYIGNWATGIIARIDGQIIHESHPGQTPAFPEKHREAAMQHNSMGEAFQHGMSKTGVEGSPLQAGVFAKHNRLPFAVDIITGLLFFALAKIWDLNTAALVGVAVGVGLLLFQRITKIDVTGGLALFGIFMLALSAGLALVFADEAWVKQRGTITGLIGAAIFLIDGLRGGPYIGKGLARYMPYADIDPGRFALAMGVIGLVMAGLNYAVAVLFSTDIWLFYKTFLDWIVVMAMVVFAIRFSRKPKPL